MALGRLPLVSSAETAPLSTFVSIYMAMAWRFNLIIILAIKRKIVVYSIFQLPWIDLFFNIFSLYPSHNNV